MKSFTVEQLGSLAALLRERVGLHIRAEGFSALKLALAARFEQPDPPSVDSDAYLDLLRSDTGDEELRRLLPLVTVGKTSFFRDERQFAALNALLPQLLARRRSVARAVSIWSAGCATGEEIYSIAMSAAEAGAEPGECEILGTDLNPEAVAAAARGQFEPRRVRDISPDLIERHFERDGDGYRVKPGLRRLLAGVRPHNLVSSIYPRPNNADGWDAIFCRNVIIYFDTPTAQEVLSRFHMVLAPGGYLFLGYSESLFRLFEGFELVEVAGAFLYRRPEASARITPGPRPVVKPPQPAEPRAPKALPPHAPAPVRHLDLTPPSGPAQPARRDLLAPQEVLDSAVGLFADGRFGAARDLLERLLSQGGDDLPVQLTLANLYGILRQPDRARESYLSALAIEPLNAEAHLFFGIHLLGTGETVEAALELSRALFLDPDMALAHYFLGRCREAQRDANLARMAYKNAIDAYRRLPEGKRQAFLGYYPDIPEDGSVFARAAEYALAAL
jgi:chemotaxis protein methyltransferase CheR